MIHFAQNNDIIIGVDFGYGNDIAVKTTAKVHEDGRLEILSSERIGRTRDIKQEHRDRIIEELKQFGNQNEKEYPCNVQEFQRHSADENPVGVRGKTEPCSTQRRT